MTNSQAASSEDWLVRSSRHAPRFSRSNPQNSDTWKIRLIIPWKFISSKGDEEERVMHSTSNNIKFTPYSDVNEVIDELFESLC